MSRDRIEAYFSACSGGDAKAIAEHFTDDAVVYDLNHGPVSGSATIGTFWVKIRSKWRNARWHVHTCIADADAAAIEWSMTGEREGKLFCVYGSEHYAFRDGRIAEIRQYWSFDPKSPGSGLVGFPYAKDPRFQATSPD